MKDIDNRSVDRHLKYEPKLLHNFSRGFDLHALINIYNLNTYPTKSNFFLSHALNL